MNVESETVKVYKVQLSDDDETNLVDNEWYAFDQEVNRTKFPTIYKLIDRLTDLM